MRLKQTWTLMKQAVSAWSDDRAPSMGAALSYYALFSIAPLLVIVISIAGLVFGPEIVRGAVFAQLADLMGEDGAKAIQEMLAHVNQPKTGALALLGSAAVLLLGASTVFGEIQASLDRIWRAPVSTEEKGWFKLIRARLLSFGMVLAFAFLITVSLLLSAALSALGKWWGPLFGDLAIVAQLLDLVVSFVSLTVAFAMIYKFIPRVPVRWRDVWVGAAVTALLFTVGKFAIGLYLGKSSVGSAFGAFGSLVIVMVWVYYSAQIFLLGAEFTRAYAHEFGSRRKGAAEAAPAAASVTAPAADAADQAEVEAARSRVWAANAASLAYRRPARKPPAAKRYLKAALAAGFVALAVLRRPRNRSGDSAR
jgi:membrane protein